MEVKTPAAEGPSTWPMALHVAGLLLLVVSERVLATSPKGHGVVRALALLLLLVASAGRVQAWLLQRPERARGQGLLAPLQLATLPGVALLLWGGDGLVEALGLQEGQLAERLSAASTLLGLVLVAVPTLALLLGDWAVIAVRRSPGPEVARVRAAVTTGAVLGLALTYGALAVFIATRVNRLADFSYFRTASPGSSTVAIARSLKAPLTVHAFFPPGSEVRPEVGGYLEQLRRQAPQVQIEWADRLMDPKLARHFRVSRDGTLVLEQGEAQQSLTVGSELDEARRNLRKLDQTFQERLLAVVRGARLVYATTGHGELGEAEGEKAKLYREVLRSQNYRLLPLGLTEGLGKEVPKDASLVAILGPTRPFAPEELTALRAYLARGGRLLLALDADRHDELAPVAAQGDSPSALAPLAELVGAQLAPGDLLHATTHLPRRRDDSDRALVPATRLSAHPVVSSLARAGKKLAFVVDGARGLEVASGKPSWDATARTPEGTFRDLDGDLQQGKTEPSGSFTVLAALDTQHGGLPEGARAVVLSDVDALGDFVLERSVGNQLVLVDSLRWLSGEESYIGELASEQDVRIQHSPEQDALWFYATIFGVPGLVLLAGASLARRHRRKESPS